MTIRERSARCSLTRALPVVAAFPFAIDGGWKGNGMGYNVAHDDALPGSRRAS